MARYIDADKLIAHLKDEIEGCKPPFSGRANGKGVAYETMLGLKMAISFAETLSTADVAPKSEVDQLERNLAQCENGYRQEMHLLQCKLANAKTEVAREIFEEIDVLVDDWKHSHIQSIQFIAELAELKKKYTEGKE